MTAEHKEIPCSENLQLYGGLLENIRIEEKNIKVCIMEDNIDEVIAHYDKANAAVYRMETRLIEKKFPSHYYYLVEFARWKVSELFNEIIEYHKNRLHAILGGLTA